MLLEGTILSLVFSGTVPIVKGRDFILFEKSYGKCVFPAFEGCACWKMLYASWAV
jgi:hypothetical protein